MPITSNPPFVRTTAQIADNAIETDDIADGSVTPAKVSNGTVGQVLTSGETEPAWSDPASIPAGTVIPYAGATAPSGYLIADGSEVSRTTQAVLFGVIGTDYGVGNGTTTFNLPNLKGKIPVGYNSAETEFDTLGETGGEKTHVLTVGELPAHDHTYNVGTSANGSNTKPAPGQGTGTNATSGSTGSGTAHNNLQPYITLNYIIKT